MVNGGINTMLSKNMGLITNKRHKINLLSGLTILVSIMILSFIPMISAEVSDDPNGVKPISPNDPLTIEAVILLDSTGSMADEILAIKSHIQNIVKETTSGSPQPVVRIGIVTYRDHPPEDYSYAYKQFHLTRDIDGLMDVLHDIDARGGGDGPEAVADGLHMAINEMDWSDNSEKVIFLIGDAPPHGVGNSDDTSFQQGCPVDYDYLEEVKPAVDLGITIYTIGCSGIEDYEHGVDVFKEIAKKTGGEYYPLKYQRVIAVEYYETENVAEEYADVSRDSTYDAESGTILVNNIKGFAGSAMKSAAMEAGVSYSDTEEEVNIDSTDSTNKSGNESNIPDLPGLSMITSLLMTASAVLIAERHG
jgi:Mg-chelatase subunit ChlD